jgi:YhcH/YjgK/YiaL family protein
LRADVITRIGVRIQGAWRMEKRRVVAVCAAAIAAVLALEVGAYGTRQAAPQKQGGVAVTGNIKDWSSTPGITGLERAFEFLARTDLAALPLGRTDIEGSDVFLTVSEAETRAPEQVKFEAHRRYIDIQLVVQGQESIGYAPVASLVTAEPYDATKDIEFFSVPQESAAIALRAGDFVVFAPGDGHRPSLHLDGPHVSRKVVVKVSVAYRDRQRAAKAR